MSEVVRLEGLRLDRGGRFTLGPLEAVLEGPRVHLAGGNGAGKTTLLRLLATLSTPSGGTAELVGRDLRADAREVRSLVGYAGHEPSLHQELPAAQALRVHADLHGVDPGRVEQAFAAWELAHVAHTPVRALSHGQRRRLDLARAMLHRPQVLLLDEPTGGLDPQARNTLQARLNALDPTISIVSAPEDPGLPTDEQLRLVDGRLEASP